MGNTIPRQLGQDCIRKLAKQVRKEQKERKRGVEESEEKHKLQKHHLTILKCALVICELSLFPKMFS